MPEPDRTAVYVHLLPALIPPGALKGGVAVAIDVLRATTVMVRALGSGCVGVVPCGEIDAAFRARSELPPGTALLGGERQGLPIEGFDLANSPGDYTPEVCRGKTLVMTTTNGTHAILASLEADRVFVAAFANGLETARALAAANAPVHLVCAGTDGHVSYEDTLLAGALVESLIALRSGVGASAKDALASLIGAGASNDSALLALQAWLDSDREMTAGTPNPPLSLSGILARGRGGNRVRQIGLAPDIDAAASTDGGVLAVLERDPLRIVRLDPDTP